MKFTATHPIQGLTGRGIITNPGDIVELPDDHPDIPVFTECGFLKPADEETPVSMTADGKPVKAVKTKAKK